MKKIIAIITAVLMMLIVSACGASGNKTEYSTVKNGTHYTVNTEERTISDGENTFYYTASGGKVYITYPNGAIYWWEDGDNFGVGGWSDNYDSTNYPSGAILKDIISDGNEKPKEPKNVPLIVILFVVGILNAAAPRVTWMMSYGWRFRNAEPSEASLLVNRAGGVVAIIIAVILIIT